MENLTINIVQSEKDVNDGVKASYAVVENNGCTRQEAIKQFKELNQIAMAKTLEKLKRIAENNFSPELFKETAEILEKLLSYS